MVPTETTGLDGGSSTRSASVIASMTPGAGRGVVEADDDDRLGGHLGAQPHPVLLEVHDPAAARGLRVGDRDVGLDPVVGHRQQPHARGVASAGTAPRSPRRAGSPRRASGCAPGGWRCRGRRARTRSARRRTPPAPPCALQVSSRRPQPRSGSMPSPRVYITVSRSGHTLSPCIQMSSAVLATTVTSASAATPGSGPCAMPCRRPWRNRAPPIPPESTVMCRMRIACRTCRIACRCSGRVADSGDRLLIPDPGLTFGVRQACNSNSVLRCLAAVSGTGHG